MRKQHTLIAVAIGIGLLIGGYAAAVAYKAKQAAAPNPGSSGYTPREYITLGTLDRDGVVGLEFPLTGLRLERRGTDWAAEPALPGPLNQAAVTAIARSLAGLQGERIIEESPQNYALYGLDPPEARIILTADTGERLEFLAGGMTPSRNGYYVMKAGDPAVYLVSAYLGAGLYADAARIREKALSSSFAPTEVRRFLVESPGFRLDIQARPDDAPFLAPFSTHIMTAPYTVSRGVGGDSFETLLQAFQNLQVLDFLDKAETVDLKPYGLDAPMRVYIETATDTLDLLLGKREAGRQYAQRRGEPEVFTLEPLEPLASLTPFSLLDKFALIVSIDRVDAVTVAAADGTTLTGEIRRQDTEEPAYLFNGRNIEEKAFKGWYQKVIGVLVDAELPQRPQRGGVPELTIAYRLNDPAGMTASIGLIPYNRDFYALESEGVAEFLVSRAQIRAIYETAPNSFK